jgi:hypothetical protein
MIPTFFDPQLQNRRSEAHSHDPYFLLHPPVVSESSTPVSKVGIMRVFESPLDLRFLHDPYFFLMIPNVVGHEPDGV